MSYTTPSMAKNNTQRSLLQIIHAYPSEKATQKIWQYFDNRCAYCDCNIEPSSRKGHLDHLIAISDGGTNDSHNLVLACSSCNGDEKRDQNWLDFLRLKCKMLPTATFEKRLNKVKSWQQQTAMIQLNPEIQMQIAQIIDQAKQDFDNAVIKMRALKQSLNS